MKNIKLNIIKGFFCVFIISSTVSCSERGYDDYDAGGTPTQTLNGEWFIDIIDEASGDVLVQHILHKTYDSNDGRMFVDDNKAGYYIKGKVDVNIPGLSFTTTNEENLADPGSTFNITNGKIIKNAAKSKDGNVVDSIYFKGEFSYDPGTIIIFSGHKRTGFLEDEY